mmetsp:Transcript_24902/g.86709  ORF Transcript_24902/g.86709 Transcript_24902/m.86709 type:complete len:464 (+) Transcript_24902:1434-2825(+)
MIAEHDDAAATPARGKHATEVGRARSQHDFVRVHERGWRAVPAADLERNVGECGRSVEDSVQELEERALLPRHGAELAQQRADVVVEGGVVHALAVEGVLLAPRALGQQQLHDLLVAAEGRVVERSAVPLVALVRRHAVHLDQHAHALHVAAPRREEYAVATGVAAELRVAAHVADERHDGGHAIVVAAAVKRPDQLLLLVVLIIPVVPRLIQAVAAPCRRSCAVLDRRRSACWSHARSGRPTCRCCRRSSRSGSSAEQRRQVGRMRLVHQQHLANAVCAVPPTMPLLSHTTTISAGPCFFVLFLPACIPAPSQPHALLRRHRRVAACSRLRSQVGTSVREPVVVIVFLVETPPTAAERGLVVVVAVTPHRRVRASVRGERRGSAVDVAASAARRRQRCHHLLDGASRIGAEASATKRAGRACCDLCHGGGGERPRCRCCFSTPDLSRLARHRRPRARALKLF